jgi:hypothetical protein
VEGLSAGKVWIDHSTTDHEQNKVHICSTDRFLFNELKVRYCTYFVSPDFVTFEPLKSDLKTFKNFLKSTNLQLDKGVLLFTF